jgi:chitinase
MLENTVNWDDNIIHQGVDVDERLLEKYSNLV